MKKPFLLFILPVFLIGGALILFADDLYNQFSLHSAYQVPPQTLPLGQTTKSGRFVKTQDQQEASQAVSKTTKVDVTKVAALIPASIKPPTVTNGFDWSLPENIKTERNSGMIDEYDRNLDYAQNVFAMVRWDETNPQKGRYNFSKFDKVLTTIAPKRVLVRLEVNSACEAPKWALKSLRSSADKSLIFWDENYLNLLKPYINAFAKRYANDPRVIGVQLGIGDGEYNNNCEFDNKNGWGEFWMSPESIATAEKKFGFNPEVFEKQAKKIINIYANAFGSNKGKLAFTNIGPSFSWNDIAAPYNQKLKKIAQYVWDKGIGDRDGHVEIWMRFIHPAFGVQLKSMSDGTCYLDFDETHADGMRGRYSGTENEFYGDKDYVKSANGPYKNQPYRFMVSSLRALQMRRNYFSIAGDSMAKIKNPVYRTQDFLRYLPKVMGKQIENTPDAFILLGERYISQDHAKNFASLACVKKSNNVAVRSFGRWLNERSKSTPALRISMPEKENYWGQNFYMPEGVDYEYSARKSKQFELTLNKKLKALRCKNGCKAEIKITFVDNVKTKLNLLMNNGTNQSFETKGDNKIKTVTFSVDSGFQSKTNNLSEADFKINSINHKLTLIMIRVTFL